MMKKTFKYISAITVCLLLSNVLLAQQSTILYTATTAEIANPDRGWYDDYRSHTGSSTLSTTYQSLSSSVLESERVNDNITLILRLFYLHEFLEEDEVSSTYLSNMQSDFDAIRDAGVKCVIRFAYSTSTSAAVWDATPEKVFSHIESLGDVLATNSDVIVAVQAGFIGVWGEWYYTNNFAGSGYSPDATDQENRRTLVKKLLDVLPNPINVQGRTPAIMQNIIETEDPISELEAFDGSYKSRIGHHNDCFLANSTDYGTYTNLSDDISYLTETTKYTITGGETCDASNEYSNCENSVPRMKELHWTYLNRDYNQSVYDKWIDENCYDEVNISLGYRIQLDSAQFSDSVQPGATLSTSLYLTNTGYAAPTQYKAIEFVLTNIETESQHVIEYAGTNDDIRHWLPGQIELSDNLSIPSDFPEGSYNLAIQFRDSAMSITDNPAYAIQLANVGLWEEETGINTLNHVVAVGAGADISLPEMPTSFAAQTLSESEIDLSWESAASSETGFEIMRSEGSQDNWISLANTDASSISYSDFGLTPSTMYYYIIRSYNSSGNSSWTSPASAQTDDASSFAERPASTIQIYPTVLRDRKLTINFIDNSEKRVQIVNISGLVSFDYSTKEVANILNLDKLKPGIYCVVIQLENETMTQKLILF